MSIGLAHATKSDVDNCTTTPKTSPFLDGTIATEGEMSMPSVGPFDLTEIELIGLEFLRQDDERQLRKTTLRATWCGQELRIRAERPPTTITDLRGEIVSRAIPY